MCHENTQRHTNSIHLHTCYIYVPTRIVWKSKEEVRLFGEYKNTVFCELQMKLIGKSVDNRE